MNPLVPNALDVVVGVACLAVAVFGLTALVSAALSREVQGLRYLGWVVLILFVPVIGPALWFGEPRRLRAPHP